MYHPAAGLHNTSLMIPLLDDWTRVGWWLKAGTPDPVEWLRAPIHNLKPDFQLATDAQQVLEYFGAYSSALTLIGGDSEWHDGVDFSVQISLRPHTGLAVLWKDEDAIRQLARCLGQKIKGGGGEIRFVFHNAG